MKKLIIVLVILLLGFFVMKNQNPHHENKGITTPWGILSPLRQMRKLPNCLKFNITLARYEKDYFDENSYKLRLIYFSTNESQDSVVSKITNTLMHFNFQKTGEDYTENYEAEFEKPGEYVALQIFELNLSNKLVPVVLLNYTFQDLQAIRDRNNHLPPAVSVPEGLEKNWTKFLNGILNRSFGEIRLIAFRNIDTSFSYSYWTLSIINEKNKQTLLSQLSSLNYSTSVIDTDTTGVIITATSGSNSLRIAFSRGDQEINIRVNTIK